jgi:hypothetical protein
MFYFKKRSCDIIVKSGAVPLLVNQLENEKFLSYENTEEVLKCLNKISIENPQILFKQKGFFENLLSCIEKLNNLESKRCKTALFLLSNIFRKATSNNFNDLSGSFKKIKSLMEDTKNEDSLSNLMTCYSNLLDRFYLQDDKLKKIILNGEIIQLLIHKMDIFENETSLIFKFFTMIIQSFKDPSILISDYFLKNGILHKLTMIFDKNEKYDQLSINNIKKKDDLYSDIFNFLNSLIPTYSNSEDFSNIIKNAYHVWKWEDDFHNFTPYDENSTKSMETAYLERKDIIENFNILGVAYNINLKEMKQYNTQSGVMRNIVRDPIPIKYIEQECEFNDQMNSKYPSLMKTSKINIPKEYSKVLKAIIMIGINCTNDNIIRIISSIVFRLIDYMNINGVELNNIKEEILDYLSKNIKLKDKMIMNNNLLLLNMIIEIESKLSKEDIAKIDSTTILEELNINDQFLEDLKLLENDNFFKLNSKKFQKEIIYSDRDKSLIQLSKEFDIKWFEILKLFNKGGILKKAMLESGFVKKFIKFYSKNNKAIDEFFGENIKALKNILTILKSIFSDNGVNNEKYFPINKKNLLGIYFFKKRTI